MSRTQPQSASSPETGSRRAQKAKTRGILREAAMDCFRTHGFAATTIDQITQAAGVAKGTFYVHFDSKEQVLDDYLASFNARFLVKLQEATATLVHRTPEQAGYHLADAFLQYWAAEQQFISIYAQRAAGGLSPEALYEGLNPVTLGFVKTLLTTWRGESPARPTTDQVDLELVVHGVLAMWLRLGLRYVFTTTDDESIRCHYAEHLTKMTLGAVFGVMPDLENHLNHGGTS